MPVAPSNSCSLTFKVEQTCFHVATEHREFEAEPFLNSIVMNNYNWCDVALAAVPAESPSAVASFYLAWSLTVSLLLIQVGD